MTCTSVAFTATLKAMNSIQFHFHILFQFYVKNAETALFLIDFPDNSLMHVGRNDFHFRAYCRLGKSEIAK